MACSGTAYHSYFVSVRFSVRVVPWFRRLVAGFSPRRTGFAPGSVHVGFVVDKVAMGQVFFSEFSTFLYRLGYEQFVAGIQRHSLAPSLYMNNTNNEVLKSILDPDTG
jgi:hypothetical protein